MGRAPVRDRIPFQLTIASRTLLERVVLARYLTARRLALATGGRRLTDAAKRYIDSLYSNTGTGPEVARRIKSTVEVDAACLLHFPFPAEWPRYFRTSKAFDARVRHRMTDVVVSPLSGLTWLPSGAIVGESIGSVHRLLGWGNVAHELLYPVCKRRLPGPIVCAVSRNYAHWLFDCFPHIIEAMESDDQVRILLPALAKHRPPFIEESLRYALGEARFASSVLYATAPHRVDELVLTAMPFDPYFVHPAVLDRLRAALAPQGEGAIGRHNVYVSRQRSPKRRMDNEEAVESLVRRYGFKIVYSEEMSFPERVNMFSTAKTVMAPHGAGLANITWCPPGATVIELLPPSRFNDYYARLSLMSGFAYAFVQAENGREPGGKVELPELERVLDDLPAHVVRPGYRDPLVSDGSEGAHRPGAGDRDP